MKEISRKQAMERNLKLIKTIVGTNLSSTILLIERQKENPLIKHYTMDLAIVKEDTHNGQIFVSFWN